jgi:hypothetical protein
MILAIDYDDTWTLDPDAWETLVTFFKDRGHTVIVVTNRMNLPQFTEVVQRDVSPFVDDVIFAGPMPKRIAASNLGYQVDVWIDDFPSAVDYGRG